MARSFASIKSSTFIYDFAVDGGAISAINMGTFIPQDAQLMQFGVEVITPLVAGIGATMAFGLVGRANAFKTATVYTVINSGLFGACNEAITKLASGLQTMVTIAANTISAGKIKCTVTFIEN